MPFFYSVIRKLLVNSFLTRNCCKSEDMVAGRSFSNSRIHSKQIETSKEVMKACNTTTEQVYLTIANQV